MSTQTEQFLFSEKSTSQFSDYFCITRAHKQVTLVAHGMMPGDYIEFQMISLRAGERDKISEGACFIKQGTPASIQAVTPLTCSCINNDDDPAVITISAEHPVLVLNGPQEVYLRGEFKGDVNNIGDFFLVMYAGTAMADIPCYMTGCMPFEYFATYAFPDTGLGYQPTDKRDPAATVELTTCGGEVVAYIYPEMNEGVTTPIYASCEAGATPAGYAIDGMRPDIREHQHCKLQKVTTVETFNPTQTLMSCGCKGVVLGYGYSQFDANKDPLATVELNLCSGSDSIFIYERAGQGHLIDVRSCNGDLIGFAANSGVVARSSTELVVV